MLAYYFVLLFIIFIVVGLHFRFYYNSDKLSFTAPILFTLCSIGFVVLLKQNLELLRKFDTRQDMRFILKERVFENRKGGRKMFVGYKGYLFKKSKLIEKGFLPIQFFYDMNDEKLSLNDSVRVWYMEENDKLILQTSKTQTNGFLIISVIESVFIIVLCNSLWYWVFRGKKYKIY
jgi:hypothetical protein